MAKKKRIIETVEIARELGVSRQYVSLILSELVSSGKLLKVGSTRNAQYAFPEYAAKHLEIFPAKIAKTFRNENLEEHRVLDEIESQFPPILKLSENVRSI